MVFVGREEAKNNLLSYNYDKIYGVPYFQEQYRPYVRYSVNS